MARTGRTDKQMSYGLRLLQPTDAPQAAEIEKDAFPTQWPPTPFKREAQNRYASYLLAWERRTDRPGAAPLPIAHDDETPPPLIQRLLQTVRYPWTGSRSSSRVSPEPLVGYVGVWFTTDEAHITAIGVRSSHRGRGIGELLIIGALELAYQRGSRVATLEVRVSNQVAQGLYRKYGFQEAGVRKGYYLDNREDALIMTTPEIRSSPYLQQFRHLLAEHERRWGYPRRDLAP